MPEYWLVDPERGTVTLYVLSGSSYGEHAEGRTGDTLSSPALPGFELSVSEVFGAS